MMEHHVADRKQGLFFFNVWNNSGRTMESGDDIQLDQPRGTTNYHSNYRSLKRVETVRSIK